MTPRTVLFVDDDDTYRKVLSKELAHAGYVVRACADGEDALEQLARTDPDVALLDLRLPGMDGLELLARVRERSPDLPVILLTGHGAVPDAVEAIRRGAYDFLTKPVSLDVLEQGLARACQHRELVRENARLRELILQGSGHTELLGTSPKLRELRALVAKVAPSGANVLVVGENGTGKELVSRRLHEQSPRAEHPFVVVHCGAIPEELVESELFGHERGAFTGADRARVGLLEAAHGGTVFLDEVGELPLAIQPSLLRAVQFGEVRPVGSSRSRRVDLRVVAATNRDLQAEVEAGRFREDLYYRLATLVVEVPPLRERPGDVALLAQHFLARQNGRLPEDRQQHFAPDALAQLEAREWRGNVRELENSVVRLATLVGHRTLTAADVERHVPRRRPAQAGGLPTLFLDDLERLAVVEALRRHEGARAAAAAELGVAVKTLYNKIRSFGIEPAEYRGRSL